MMQFESFGVRVAKMLMTDTPIELYIQRSDFLEYCDGVKESEAPAVVRFMDHTGRLVRSNASENAAYYEEIYPTKFGNMHEFYRVNGGSNTPEFLVVYFKKETYSLVLYPKG